MLRRLPFPQLFLYVFALIFCLLHLRWQGLDHVPPAWDQAGYLLQAALLFDAGKTAGWSGFIHQFLHYDPGRVYFTTVLVQPFFAVFGVSYRTAMIPYALAWFPAAWAISGVARETGTMFFGLARQRAMAAGCLAFLLFAFNQETQILSQSYLVEFPLAVLVAITNYCALAYRRNPNPVWLIVGGLAAGCGMLTKVTFLVFVLPAVLVHAVTLFETSAQPRVWRNAVIPVLAALVVCGPYYAINFKWLYKTTRFLSSAQLAQTFGLPDTLDPTALINFLRVPLGTYEYALCCVAALGFVIVMLIRPQRAQHRMLGLLFLGVWFLLPFFVVWFSPFKEERYYYPAETGLAVLAGLMLSALATTWLRTGVLALLFAVPVAKCAAINGAVLPPTLPRLAMWARPPDSSSHNIDASVMSISDTLDAYAGEGATDRTVILLGATSPHCNGALLRYTALHQGRGLNIIFLPAFGRPDFMLQDALTFIHATPHAAVLYQTQDGFPVSLRELDGNVASALSTDPAYERRSLPFAEPGGCAFDMFVKSHPNSNPG